MFADNNSGTFGILICLIVLVMTGVGLSLLADRRFHFSSSGAENKQTITFDAERLAGLTEQRDHKKSDWEKNDGPRHQRERELQDLKITTASQKQRISALRESLEAAKAANLATTTSFATYRETYRKQTWEKAAGEQYPFLALRNGRRYEKVTIQRVTAAGLEITHADGRGRIDATDLDAAWQDRFQWNDAERQAVLDEERRNLASIAAPTPTQPAAPPKRTEAANAEDSSLPVEERIQKLQVELLAWNQKVSALSDLHREAASQSGNTDRPAVPGSLETWSARASRLASELRTARLNQSQTRARLRSLAPDDPLLQVQSYR